MGNILRHLDAQSAAFVAVEFLKEMNTGRFKSDADNGQFKSDNDYESDTSDDSYDSDNNYESDMIPTTNIGKNLVNK